MPDPVLFIQTQPGDNSNFVRVTYRSMGDLPAVVLLRNVLILQNLLTTYVSQAERGPQVSYAVS